MSDLFVDNSNTSNSSTTLLFSNNKNMSYNQIKNKILSNLNKANKVLDKNNFNKLKQELITNMKNNNNFVVDIDENGSYISNVISSDYIGGDSDLNNTSVNLTSINTEEKEKTSESSTSTAESTEQQSSTSTAESTEENDEEDTKQGTEESTDESDIIKNNTINKKTSEPLQEEQTEETLLNKLKFWGGKNVDDKNYESDNDNNQTYMMETDDDDEESFIDKAKLNSAKYLKTLNVKYLRNIMRDNNMKLSNNGSYLKKNEMVKKITKKFK